MNDYKIISTFICDGIKMLLVKTPAGSCCTMEESEYDRMMIKDMAYGKRNKKVLDKNLA